ncbi:uncharacterized protein LOC115458412 [Microcaecilia unicolor]|uniref:Uncharacterized protein LOC115458412 n=1 Tax=Microcaecilia unicolor TaxID=1415580 RepID=A0A6P7WV23_9AMPH|nr:uncharacterized protein LOC115458412 [Microcaecilia unicolor]
MSCDQLQVHTILYACVTATSKKEETTMNGKARGEGLEVPGSAQVVLTLVALAATTVALRWLFFNQRKKPRGGSESEEMPTNLVRKGCQDDQQEHSSSLPGQRERPSSPEAPISKVSNKQRERVKSCNSCGNTNVLKVNFVCDGCQMQDVTHDWNIAPDKRSSGYRADTKPAQDRDPQKAIYSANTPSTLFPKQETVSIGKSDDLGLHRDSILPWPLRQTWGINNNEVQYHAQEELESCNFKTSPENRPYLRSDSIREDDTGLDAGALGNWSTHYISEGVAASLGGRRERGNEKLFVNPHSSKDDTKKLKAHLLPFPQDDATQLLQTEQSKTQESNFETCLEGTGDCGVEKMYCFTSASEKEASFTMTSISACLQNGKDSNVSSCVTDDHGNHKQSQSDPFGQCLSKPRKCRDEEIFSYGESSKDRQQIMKIHSLERSTQDSHSYSSSSETKSTAQNKNPERVPGLHERENISVAASSLNEENLTTAASSGVELGNDDSGSAVYLNKKKQIQEQERAQSKPDNSTKNKDSQRMAKYSIENTNPSQDDNGNFQLSSLISAQSQSIKVSITPDCCPPTEDLLCRVNKNCREWRREQVISSMEPDGGQHLFVKENADFLHSNYADLPCLYCDEVNISAKTMSLETENSVYQKDTTYQPSYSHTWNHNRRYCAEDIPELKEKYQWAKKKTIWQSNQEISLNSIPEKETEEERVSAINAMSYPDSSAIQVPETSESGYSSKNVTPITETRSWSSLGTYSQEDDRTFQEQDVIQKQMDCAVEPNNGMVNSCQVTFQQQSGELTIANNDQNKDDVNEENCIFQKNNMSQTKHSKPNSLFMPQSLEFGWSSSEIQPYNTTTDSFLQDVNEEERDCDHDHPPLQLDNQFQDYCSEDKQGSQHESTKHRKTSNEAGCMTILSPTKVTKRASKDQEQEHPYHTTDKADLADACETEDLRHSDCALGSNWEINLVNNNNGSTTNLEIKHTDTGFAGIASLFQDELHKPNRTPQKAAARFLSLNKTWETENIIVMPSAEQKVNTCQHLTRKLSETPSASMQISSENRNKESQVDDSFHNDLLPDKTTNQSSSNICGERTSAVLPGNQTMTEEVKEPRSQHVLSLSSASLPTCDIQDQSKVMSGRHLLQRKRSMSEIAEQQQLRFQVNSISDHKSKPTLVTRSCEDILSGAPREKINQRSKAQSMICLLTEHYSQHPRGQGNLVEFVSKGSFIHIPESLQDIVDAMKLQLTLDNCLELLRFAKKHGAVDLQAAAYAVMSDNYLQVLRDLSLYRQLSGGERDQILQLRMRGNKVLGTVTLQNIYGMRSNSQSQSCSLGNNLPSPSLTIGSEQKPWLYIFHLQENSWHPLTPVPEEANLKGCGVCSMHNYLFLAGGIQGQGLNAKCSNKVFCYNPLTEIWSQLAPMNQARSQLKLVPVDGYLYAIGGECLYTVERYDPHFDKWTFRASLPKGSFAVAHEAANCNGDIYISGGNLFYRLFRYIPLKDLWEECPYNTSRKRSSDMVAVRSFLYRFDIHRDLGVSVFRYNTITKVWNEYATLCLKTSLPFRCTVLADTIFCLNRKMTARFLAHERPPRFESENLCPFPDNSGAGVLCPFIISLPQTGCFQTPV